jgi:hypothetical protein
MAWVVVLMTVVVVVVGATVVVVVGATVDTEGALYARYPLLSQEDFYHQTAVEPKHGYEDWPEVRPRAPVRGRVPDKVRLISTELGLSDNDEVRILDHFYENQWSQLTGEAM